jgi:hypothetical protein
MKIYTVELDMTLVMGRLKSFHLKEFNSEYPTVFVEANDPDDACYFTICKFSEVVLKQNESPETAKLLRDVIQDIRIKKAYCKDEKRLRRPSL